MRRRACMAIIGLATCLNVAASAMDEPRLGSPLGAPAAEGTLRKGGEPDWLALTDGLLPAARMASNVHERLTAISKAPHARLRGAREVQLYSRISPSVVLIVTPEGIGSGSVVGASGEILTNWHVVRDQSNVVVVYKPDAEGARVSPKDARRARVVRVDAIADLALVETLDAKPGVSSIELGSMESVAVGADVHAIGHPTGEGWTYTKGVVSQIRRSHEWSTELGVRHQANVIQTQTPINPGNSGGPLLDDHGRLLGVNAFKAPGTEGLNFAIDVGEVGRFLSSKESRLPPSASQDAPLCEPRVLTSDRLSDPPATRHSLDLDCDGRPDAVVVEPDSRSSSILILIDSNGDGRIDAILEDSDRDGQVDTSLWDVDGDGEVDLKGYHTDGNPEPSRLERLDERTAD